MLRKFININHELVNSHFNYQNHSDLNNNNNNRVNTDNFNKNNSKIILICVAIAVLIIIVVILIRALSSNKKSQEDVNISETVEEKITDEKKDIQPEIVESLPVESTNDDPKSCLVHII